MRVLIIAAASDGATPRHRDVQQAARLRDRGHDIVIAVVVPQAGSARRRESRGDVTADGIPVYGLELPIGDERRPAAFDAALRAALPEAIRSAGISRPDLVLVGGTDASTVVARHLSVLHGVPFALHAGAGSPLGRSAQGRYAELLSQSVYEAQRVAASTPEAAEELRTRYALLRVDVVPDSEADDTADTLASWCEQALRRADAPRMVFHAPYPLDPAPTSASRRRPNKMLEAFEDNGYRPHRITGNPFQRRLAFDDLRRAVARGESFEFLYSENSTQPNVLATSLRRGIAPLLEAQILWFCDRHGIAAGQFYRDVYWRFPRSLATSPLLRRTVMHLAYRIDLQVLRRSSVHLFLPSLPMAQIVPFPEKRCTALPPGTAIHESTSPRRLDLLYVGSVGSGYEIDESLRALRDLEDVDLTIVVPERVWEANRERYAPLLTERVRVVHASSNELPPLYDEASACLLMMEPDEYRRFAVPLKLYEYLGYGKPTIASAGTLAGSIVEELGIGFTVPNERTELVALLERLREDHGTLDLVAEQVREERHRHTWSMRARTVADVLTGSSSG